MQNGDSPSHDCINFRRTVMKRKLLLSGIFGVTLIFATILFTGCSDGSDNGGGNTDYTVTFNGNGGNSPSSQTVNAGSSLTLPSTTQSGYTLNGWYTSSSGGTKAGNAGASYTPSASITLYAQWTQSITTYTVTYNGNGGSAPSSQTVNAGSSTTLPSITRSNYTLNGWYTSSSGGTKAGNAGASYTPSASITLYAQWTQSITTYTVTYNGNGGSTPSSQTVDAGDSLTLPSTTQSGYTLNGWYTSSSGGTKAGNAGASYTPSASVTLYAQWTQNGGTTYTVTYNGNGGSTPYSQTVDAGDSLTLPSTTRSGYTLNGWYTSSSGGTKAGNAGASYTPSASVTLYAQWTQDKGEDGATYTVAFDGNGGTSPYSQTVDAGDSLTLPFTTRSDYTLDGWYTSSSGGTKAGNAGASYTPSASITLYAQWTQDKGDDGITYTVAFDGNGGTSPYSQTVDAGDSLTLPFTTRSDYTLDGWYTSSSGGTKAGNAGASYTPSASVTLYAQWTQDKGEDGATYTVTVDASEGGSISASPTSGTAGTTVTLSNTADYGYVFSYYTVDGTQITGNSFTLTGDVKVSAVFNPISASTYTVTVDTYITGGSINASPTSGIAGTTVTLSNTVDYGYVFSYYTVDGTQITGNSFTLNNNATVSAVFSAQTSTGSGGITIIPPGTGISADDMVFSSAQPSTGYSTNFTITAPSGYDEYRWRIDGQSRTGNTNTFTVTVSELANGNHSVTAIVIKDGIPYSAVKSFTIQH
jgi:uncharacterized repeat protein (TIGR02543 family)